MEIQTKTPPKIESQLGAFLMSDYPPGTFAYKGMADAVGEFVEAVDNPERTKQLIHELNPYARQHDKDSVYRQFASFLKHLPPEKRAEIEQIASLFESYESFKEDVDEIIARPTEIIGHGRFSRVHPLRRGSHEYAVRVPYLNSRVAMDEVHKHLEAGLLTTDIPHMEHIVAASYADGVTVAELAPGVSLGELSTAKMRAISAQQIEDLFSAMQVAYQRGVRFDLLGDNILYDPEYGFTAVDVSIAEEDGHQFAHPTKALIESLEKNLSDRNDASRPAILRGIFQKLQAIVMEKTPDDTNAYAQLSRYIDQAA